MYREERILVLNKLTVKNFKSFGEESQVVDLSTITLLFGKNGAGKSSILQALGYLYELFINNDADPQNLTICGNKFVGGFKNLVHKKDIDKEMEFKLDFVGLETMGPKVIVQESSSINLLTQFYKHGIFPGSLKGFAVCHCSIKLVIQYNPYLKKVEVPSVSVEINKEHMFDIELYPEKEGFGFSPPLKMREFNTNHALLKPNKYNIDYFEGEGIIYTCDDELVEKVRENNKLSTHLKKYSDNDSLRIHIDSKRSFPHSSHLHGIGATTDYTSKYTEEYGSDSLIMLIEKVLSIYYRIPFDIADKYFRDMLHVGPLRIAPSRYFEPQLPVDKSQWYDGTAAWSALFEEKAKIEEANQYISEIMEETHSIKITSDPIPLISLIKNDTKIAPADTGLGFSQIFPSIMAATYENSAIRTCLIEQPELHLHPKLQLNVADFLISTALRRNDQIIDLFNVSTEKFNLNSFRPHVRKPEIRAMLDYGKVDIEDYELAAAFYNQKKQWIIETHSEHIILRLLRRIRETDKNQFHGGIKVQPSSVSTIVVQNYNGQSVLSNLKISRDGDFEVSWPDGFFDERDDELF